MALITGTNLKCCLLCREVGRAFAHFLVQATFIAKTSPLLAALSSVAGGHASRHGAGALLSLEVIGDGWIPELLDFSLKKGDVATQGWVITWRPLPEIMLGVLMQASNGV